MYEIIFAAALGTAVVVATLTLRYSTNTWKAGRNIDAAQPVHIEEIPSSSASTDPPVNATSNQGVSDEGFKDIFLNADRTIEEIAKACGYKSRSSVYRRAKKLGLSMDMRKK